MEYINTLPVWHLALLALTIVVGLSFSIKNYLYFFTAPLVGKFTQSDLGKFIDWFWLASVLVLTTLYMRG